MIEKFFIQKVPTYFETEEVQLILGDSFEILTKIEPESVDMIFADPPYFLSNNGVTCHGGKMVSVNNGSWDRLSESGTGVEEKHKFNRKWIKLCKKVLKPDGTIWISGTLHNIYSIGMALEQEGFKIINNITWQKTNPHQTWHVGASHILQRLFYGQERMIRSLDIFLIIRR